MEDLRYLDVDGADSHSLECRSESLSPDARELLSELYDIDRLFDPVDGFKGGDIGALKDHLDLVQGYPRDFGYPREDLVRGAQFALRVGAYHDAENGIIWPNLKEAPFKTFYSHPWEHADTGRGFNPNPIQPRYPSTKPTGVTMHFGWSENAPQGRRAQRIFSVGGELPVFYHEFPGEEFARGTRVIRDVYKIRRNDSKSFLDYLAANRNELREFVKQRIDPSAHDLKLWNVRLDLSKIFDQDLASRGRSSDPFKVPPSKHFTFDLDRYGVHKNTKDPDIEKDMDAVTELTPDEKWQIVNELIYFTLIDLAMDSSDGSLTKDRLFNSLMHEELFRKCLDDYREYGEKNTAIEHGAVPPFLSEPRPLYGMEVYFLVTHAILFECNDIMHAFNSLPEYTDVDGPQRAGERFIYIEDLAKKMSERGIPFGYLEEVVSGLYNYFSSLGITIIRRSGRTDVDQGVVDTHRRIREFFSRREADSGIEELRLGLLAKVPFVREGRR